VNCGIRAKPVSAKYFQKMKKSNILTEREFLVTDKDTGGARLNWYSHQSFLRNKFSSILRVELMDTTSSCGDWSGFILQRHGNSVVAIDYCQTNTCNGFTINTGKVFASYPYRLHNKILSEIKEAFINIFYR